VCCLLADKLMSRARHRAAESMFVSMFYCMAFVLFWMH